MMRKKCRASQGEVSILCRKVRRVIVSRHWSMNSERVENVFYVTWIKQLKPDSNMRIVNGRSPAAISSAALDFVTLTVLIFFESHL